MIVSNPNRPLDRGVEMSKFEYYCRKLAPYIIVLFSVILVALAFIVLVRYGGAWFGTEANHWQNMGGII
jgi:hypothetical protein